MTDDALRPYPSTEAADNALNGRKADAIARIFRLPMQPLKDTEKLCDVTDDDLKTNFPVSFRQL